jgi:hypothetical protein
MSCDCTPHVQCAFGINFTEYAAAAILVITSCCFVNWENGGLYTHTHTHVKGSYFVNPVYEFCRMPLCNAHVLNYVQFTRVKICIHKLANEKNIIGSFNL